MATLTREYRKETKPRKVYDSLGKRLPDEILQRVFDYEISATDAARELGCCNSLVTKEVRKRYKKNWRGSWKWNREEVTKSERNESIFRRYQNGETLGQIGGDLGITRQRVEQIVKIQSKKTGEKVREPIFGRRPGTTGIGRTITDDMLKKVATYELYASEVAGMVGCNANTVLKQVHKRLRIGKMDRNRIRSQISFAIQKDIYEQFMSGTQMKELAKEYGTTFGNIGQYILKYRKKTGLPGKNRPWYHKQNNNGVRK